MQAKRLPCNGTIGIFFAQVRDSRWLIGFEAFIVLETFVFLFYFCWLGVEEWTRLLCLLKMRGIVRVMF